jgi:outer membrane protein OmpA-like peptidoglycan-associated protein
MILLLALLFVIASFFVLGLALRMPSARPSVMADPKADTAISPAVEDTLERLREQQDASLTQIADLRSTISRLQVDLQKDSSETAPWPGDAGGPQSLLVLGGGVFEYAGIEPARAAQDAIDKVMGVIHSRPNDGILVEGHSDSSLTGSNSAVVFEANQRISLLRAQAVARILERKGISADRIVIRGYGDTRPLASNATPEGRSQNRRAEIKLIPSLQKR